MLPCLCPRVCNEHADMHAAALHAIEPFTIVCMCAYIFEYIQVHADEHKNEIQYLKNRRPLPCMNIGFHVCKILW